MSQTLKQLWKNSSSLIILGRNNDTKLNNFNYKVLTLERPSKSSYPGAIVFPGGVCEQVDQVEDWLKFFKKFGVDDTEFKSITKSCTNRSFIFKQSPDTINKDISLRITAIRETFEELGILICKNKQQLNEPTQFSHLLQSFDVEHWQKKVYDDASNFLRLCEELNVIPDVWSLHEWSVWLTPTFKRQKRFETVFYLVGVNSQPNIEVSNSEVQRSLWQTPAELLEMNKSKKIWLPPPQLYELSRLNHAMNIDEVVQFARHRGINSTTTLIFPIHFHTSDGIIACYPGDDFYPKNPNYFTTEHDLEKYADKTCEECRKMAKNVNRMESQSLQDVQIWYTIDSTDKHLSPQTVPSSKL